MDIADIVIDNCITAEWRCRKVNETGQG